MMQFVIIGKDGVDDSALDRRMAVRSAHLEGVIKLRDNNNYISGGATLNEAGQMNGSVMFVQFETTEAFNEWYTNEPYIKGQVWENVEVKPFREARV